MFRDISLTDLLIAQNKGEHTFVDVRSPREFKESTIPGNINIPVFNDEERADEAMVLGLAIFSGKLPTFIATAITVFCWRGGMRSKTAATVLDLMGIHAKRLNGGIRSCSQWVVHELEDNKFLPKLFVLNGFTGLGKTINLKKLYTEGYPVIDLEGMAGHTLYLEPSNQKKIDSLLLKEVSHYENEPFVFIEGQSRSIGKVSLPEILNDKKEKEYNSSLISLLK